MAIDAGVYADLRIGEFVNLRDGLVYEDGSAAALDDALPYAVQNLGNIEVFLAERTDAQGQPPSIFTKAVRKLEPGEALPVTLRAGGTVWAYVASSFSRIGVTEE